MIQILIKKLGGLLGRRFYQMPFTRTQRLTLESVYSLRALCEECIQNRGVIIVLPEHLLSFKLMGIEGRIAGDKEAASHLLDMQKFFDNVSRDVPDESDMNFSPKFELIYTMGSQRTIELAPDRWQIIQSFLQVLPRVALNIKENFAEGIEIVDSGDRHYPRIRLLDSDAVEQFVSRAAPIIMDAGIHSLPTGTQDFSIKAELTQYITEANLTARGIKAVEKGRFGQNRLSYRYFWPEV